MHLHHPPLRRVRRALVLGAAVLATAPVIADRAAASTPADGPGCEGIPGTLTIGATGRLAFLSNLSFLAARGQRELDAVADEFCTEFEYADVGSGADSVAALIGGAIDICVCAMTSSAIATAQGEDLVAVAQPFEGATIALVGASEHEAELGTDLAAYADATWGITAVGSSTDLYARDAATEAGLAWDDLDVIAFGDISAAQAGLESNRLDLVSVDALTATRILDAGSGYIVFHNSPFINGSPIVMKTSFVEAHPDFVQALVDALRRGVNLVHENIDDPAAVFDLLDPADQELMADGFDGAFVLTVGALGGDGGFTAERNQASVDYLVRHGLLTEADADGALALWDNQFNDASTVEVTRLDP